MDNHICTKVILAGKKYDAITLEYANEQAHAVVLAVRNIDQEGLKTLDDDIEEYLGNSLKVENCDSNKQKIYSKQFQVGDFKITADLWDMSNRRQYEYEFGFLPIAGEIQSWGEAEEGKRHVALQMKEYYLPERVPNILLGFKSVVLAKS